MSNNRLYIIDTETNEKLLLAKSFGQWIIHPSNDEITNWLENRDCGATTGIEPTKLKLITE